MPVKLDDDDKERKGLAEDSTSLLASIKGMADKALKRAPMVAKTPNAEAMKPLIEMLDNIMDDTEELKKLLKDMKKLCK